MNIPRSLYLPETPFPNNKPENSATWISVAEAAALLKVRPSTVVNRIERGSLVGKRSPDLPFTIDGKENYVILVESLPIKAQYAYQVAHLREGSFVSVDLASPRSTFGDVWISQFVNIAQLLCDAETIRRKYHGTGEITKQLKTLARSYGISLSTLYRFSGQTPAKTVSLLYTDPIYLQNKLPKTMCLWSCDIAYALFLDRDNHYSQSGIQKELEKKRNAISCSTCPYHPDAERRDFDSDIPICTKVAGTMIVPNHRKTINRLLSHIPPELLLFCRKGYREWRAMYGLFSLREKPLLKGENYQGDHHIFDLFVRIKIRKIKNGKSYEKVIAIRPVLTAWMDTATGYIVGWVISVLPNSDTIAEAFCRACVPTVGDMAAGLPKSITVDCGKDFKSKLLEDPCTEYSAGNWEEPFLNRRFSGLGILHALGVEVYHTLPYHPQSKSIERFFGRLEQEYISKLPGWCRSNIKDRPANFSKQLDQMLKNGELLWLDEFVQKFEKEILPAYHGKADAPLHHPELPDWHLTFESMSPAQRYRSSASAREAIPDWKTMSILKRHYYPDQAKVGKYGVRFQNVYYTDEALSEIPNKWVSILCHSFTPPYAPSSITVLYNGKAICEAYPKNKNSFIEESSAVIAENADIQNRPANKMQRAVTRISRMTNTILPHTASVHELSLKEQLREETYGQTPVIETVENPLETISSAISAATKNDSVFSGSEKGYDTAYSLLFGETE